MPNEIAKRISNDEYLSRYLESEAPSAFTGRLGKFDKSGKFIYADDGSTIPESTNWIFLGDESAAYWVKFGGEGETPERRGGLLLNGTRMPLREELGDTNEADWPVDLDGKRADPWRHEMLGVFQNQDSGELVTFSTMSKTGRRSLATLLKHYLRNVRISPGTLPLVRFVRGSFRHERYGDIATPNFKVVGRVSAEGAASSDHKVELNDDIPF